MERDRIVGVDVQGLRCLADVSLRFSGLTVLIGENGTGKSSFLEVLEILRCAAAPSFWEDLQQYHGGMPRLLGHGATGLRLRAWIDGPGGPLEYDLGLGPDGAVLTEHLHHEKPPPVDRTGPAGKARSRPAAGRRNPSPTRRPAFIERTHLGARVWNSETRASEPIAAKSAYSLVLPSFGDHPPNPDIERAQNALAGIDVHVPFEVRPEWVARRHQQAPAGMRGANVIRTVDALVRHGDNLANAYFALRKSPTWSETLEYVQLGLGDEVEDVSLEASPGGSQIALEIKYRHHSKPTPVSTLSDGTLAYLAFVALYRLGDNRSLLAFDEPETHLHPGLLSRVLDMFESLSREHPVVLATHSDRLLDGLSDPVASAVLFELDEQGRTVVLRPDGKRLAAWLEQYRGLGAVRADGHERDVMARPKPAR